MENINEKEAKNICNWINNFDFHNDGKVYYVASAISELCTGQLVFYYIKNYIRDDVELLEWDVTDSEERLINGLCIFRCTLKKIPSIISQSF